MYNIQLVVGDWSRDGHEEMDQYNLISNLNKEDVEVAYRAGCEAIGMQLEGSYCDEYEDDFVPKSLFDKLNIKIEDLIEKWEKPEWLDAVKEFDEDYDEEDQLSEEDRIGYKINSKIYVNLYLLIVKRGNPEFEYSFIEAEEICIGGYGLFS